MRSVCHGRIRKPTPSHCQPYWAKRSCYRTPHTRESFWLLRGGPSCLGFGIQWPCPAKSHWACPICPTCWHNHSIRSLTEIWQILISMLSSWSLSIRGAGLRWGGGSKNWGSSKGINQIRLWGKWTIVTSGASLIRWTWGYPCKVSCWLPYVPYKDRKIQPSTIDGYSSAIADKLGNSPFNISKDKNLARLLDSFHRDRPKGRRGIPSWNLSLVLHQLNKALFEPIKEASLKLLTFKTVFFLALRSGKRRSEIHAWQNKNIRHQSMNPIGQRCPCIHYPAFYPRIGWSGGSRQCGLSGYTNPGPPSLDRSLKSDWSPFFRLEHCATIWTGPQTSSRIRRWLFCLL